MAKGGFTASLVSVLRGIFSREELPPPPPRGDPAPAATSTLALLFAPDSLPPAPPAAAGPADASHRSPSRGLLALLFAPDPLPPDLPPPARRPGRWLAWLLAAEPLDP